MTKFEESEGLDMHGVFNYGLTDLGSLSDNFFGLFCLKVAVSKW